MTVVWIGHVHGKVPCSATTRAGEPCKNVGTWLVNDKPVCPAHKDWGSS